MVFLHDHLTTVYMGLGLSLEIIIYKGYTTDGASVPSGLFEDSRYHETICKVIRQNYPSRDLEATYNWLVGGAFDMPRLLAAIVHDALYDLHWAFRWLCDRVYRRILLAAGYDRVRADIEYSAIRVVGWHNWDAITRAQKKRAKELVSVRWVRSF